MTGYWWREDWRAGVRQLISTLHYQDEIGWVERAAALLDRHSDLDGNVRHAKTYLAETSGEAARFRKGWNALAQAGLIETRQVGRRKQLHRLTPNAHATLNLRGGAHGPA